MQKLHPKSCLKTCYLFVLNYFEVFNSEPEDLRQVSVIPDSSETIELPFINDNSGALNVPDKVTIVECHLET